ncbi:MAG: class I SAM-dependent DNA methyltransferase [Acidobacteriia bacterium]|nr:class I SAM-dependent DNA methyltransferase [Terriglobia bacterium]
MPKFTIIDFVNKWQAATLTERQGAQMHFIELCDVLGEPHPAAEDFSGSTYTFEKAVITTEGGQGFADVWKRDHFAWEYKSKDKDLHAAYQKLLTYREGLENPPLLVVCDLARFEVHTNFTGTAKGVYRFSLHDLLKNQAIPMCSLPPLEVLRALFSDPSRLRPDRTAAEVTEMAAGEFATLADSLRARGNDPQRAAHFLMRLLFCLFAEDIGLLPPKLFSSLLERTRGRPGDFKARLADLFQAMSEGGAFGIEDIAHFNGDLFTDAEAFDLSVADLETLLRVSALDWSSIEPAIFGTLFERSLDLSKRSQLGMHYTSREDIQLIVEPVLMSPLRARWIEVRIKAEKLLEEGKSRKTAPKKVQSSLRKLLLVFVDELSHVRVLDPACGSGNFLYVSLKLLLDLWKEASVYAATRGLPLLPYQVNPAQLYGIETNVYAHELASVVVWIGYIQWLHDNGFGIPPSPILQRLHNIRHMDAVLAHDEDGKPVEPEWPEVDVIIGNPPFLGGNKIRQELGDEIVGELFALYEDRVPAFADLVCYWFEKARAETTKHSARAVLLATNSIRGGVNRRVLERIKESGDIFWAQSDRDWILDGANVRVSMVGFDAGLEAMRELDGKKVAQINSDLTAEIDVTGAAQLEENNGVCFMGPSAKGPFDIDYQTACSMLDAPVNVNNCPNSDVVRPVATGVDLVRKSRNKWTIDFGTMSVDKAVQYELPFEYLKQHVYPIRSKNRRSAYAKRWWQYGEVRPGMRKALEHKTRYISTPAVSKHRVFVWVAPEVLCNQGTLVFARADDYFFGVLHSRLHEVWALRKGTELEDRPRYTPTSTFETFPLPWPPGKEPKDDLGIQAIATAAKEMVEKRDDWLNPAGASPAELKKRTLTNLYNQRPQWLGELHKKLDAAVCTAYGWPSDIGNAEILQRLLDLNRERAAISGAMRQELKKGEES